ncbi:hypothetical protein QVD17_16295 [Tagetes erecta]|uniref:Uncharacterized protein n=1 Tax=Tagetes erecta TaxID=13708 RepID=A0AAD8NTE3_TARER|nr:hypothetical protein QVD17_16295 [Tagetes erecta]
MRKEHEGAAAKLPENLEDLRQRNKDEQNRINGRNARIRRCRNEVEYKNKITYFVTKLPNDCNRNGFWRAYEHHHNLMDASIPSKKDKWGNVLSFLRFVDVEDAYAFKKELEKTLVDGKKVWLSIARWVKENEGADFGVANRPTLQHPLPPSEVWTVVSNHVKHSIQNLDFIRFEMSSSDINQSRICSDDEETRFSSVHREDELKVMLNYFPHHMRSTFEKWIRVLITSLTAYVKEEIELSPKNQAKTITQRSNNFVPKNLELRISNIISPLWTGDDIKCIDGMPVIVTLIDSCTKEEVKSGPEASAKVEIVVIEAEVEDGINEFECKLVCYMEGKKSSHVNKLPLKLLKGTVVFPRVSFVRSKKWMKISNLRLQARFVDSFDGVHVKDALTEPFQLKDLRIKENQKHDDPSLDDDVWRLCKINKKKTLAKDLIYAEFTTAPSRELRSLTAANKYEMLTSIAKIFDGAKHGKSLKATVEHARKCPAILKYSGSCHQKAEVIFNVSGEVLGLYQGDSFLSGDALSQTQKDFAKKLVISAFQNWRDVILANKDQLTAHSLLLLNKNMLHDEKDPDPQLLPGFLRARYIEIYRGFEGPCTSIRLEPEKNGSFRKWRKLFFVVTFTRSFDDCHARKKRRFS